jgi:predicted RNase H-like HicB family nuclease
MGGKTMIIVIESVLQTKIDFRYVKDEDNYVASTSNVLGDFTSFGKTPDDAVRRLKSKLFGLLAEYVHNQKVNH